MILFAPGADLFAPSALPSHPAAIVNPVNCEGVAGAGVAAEVKRRLPLAHSDYVEACKKKLLRPGGHHSTPMLSREDAALLRLGHLWRPGPPARWVIHVATKDRWREPSRADWVRACARSLEGALRQLRPASVVVPALGCGKGGLHWDKVGPGVVEELSRVPDETTIVVLAVRPA